MNSGGLRWLDSQTAEVAGTRFLVTAIDEEFRDLVSDDERFVLLKDPEYLRTCVDRFAIMAPRNVVEIGIWQGGSAVFWNLVLRPERHLAFDLYDRAVQPLHEFASAPARHGRLEVRFGVDQSDHRAVTAAAEAVFEGEPIDLVIDDGAHSYPESRAAFESLFPLLRPGGVYVIEDWAWAHAIVSPWIHEFSRNRPALTNLVVELMMICGSRTDVVADIFVEPRGAFVTRGPATLRTPFRMADEYSNRGVSYRPLI